jgi:hypothetical protein
MLNTGTRAIRTNRSLLRSHRPGRSIVRDEVDPLTPVPPCPKGIDLDRWRMIVMPLVELLRGLTAVELQW